MTYYAGIDVSLRTVNICVVNDDGELIAETKVSLIFPRDFGHAVKLLAQITSVFDVR